MNRAYSIVRLSSTQVSAGATLHSSERPHQTAKAVEQADRRPARRSIVGGRRGERPARPRRRRRRAPSARTWRRVSGRDRSRRGRMPRRRRGRRGRSAGADPRGSGGCRGRRRPAGEPAPGVRKWRRSSGHHLASRMHAVNGAHAPRRIAPSISVGALRNSGRPLRGLVIGLVPAPAAVAQTSFETLFTSISRRGRSPPASTRRRELQAAARTRCRRTSAVRAGLPGGAQAALQARAQGVCGGKGNAATAAAPTPAGVAATPGVRRGRRRRSGGRRSDADALVGRGLVGDRGGRVRRAVGVGGDGARSR